MLNVVESNSNLQSQTEVKRNFQLVRGSISRLVQRLEKDRESVVNESYAGSEAGDSDYGYVIRRWLLQASTVFDEAATQDRVETGSFHYEFNQTSNAEDEDTSQLELLDTPKAVNEKSFSQSTNIGLALTGIEKSRYDTNATADHHAAERREDDEGRSTSLPQSPSLPVVAKFEGPGDAPTKQINQVECNLSELCLIAGLRLQVSTEFVYTIRMEGLDHDSQKTYILGKLRELGMTEQDIGRVMIYLNRRPGEESANKIEKAVTHVFVATQRFVNTLQRWSEKLASKDQVSAAHIQLKYEFILACSILTRAGLDVSRLGNLPDLMQTLMKKLVAKPPSYKAFQRHFFKIIDVMMDVLSELDEILAKSQAKEKFAKLSLGDISSKTWAGSVANAWLACKSESGVSISQADAGEKGEEASTKLNDRVNTWAGVLCPVQTSHSRRQSQSF